MPLLPLDPDELLLLVFNRAAAEETRGWLKQMGCDVPHAMTFHALAYAIVHPEVERMRVALVEQARARGDRVVVCDIPLLFERKMTEQFDRIVLVDAPRPVRLERLVTGSTV